jgi:hypothetical protein
MLHKFWQRITASRRAVCSAAADSPSTRAPLHDAAHNELALREEITRLRAENRALLNSILGIAGIPPIIVSEAEAATEAAMLHAFPPTAALAQKPVESSSAPPRAEKPESPAPKRVRFKSDLRPPHRGTPQKNAPAPRRRSWQQINRMLELAAARKPSQET